MKYLVIILAISSSAIAQQSEPAATETSDVQPELVAYGDAAGEARKKIPRVLRCPEAPQKQCPRFKEFCQNGGRQRSQELIEQGKGVQGQLSRVASDKTNSDIEFASRNIDSNSRAFQGAIDICRKCEQQKLFDYNGPKPSGGC